MKPIFTSEVFLQRRQWTTYSSDARRGSGYCHDQGQRFELVKVWKLWNWPVFQRVIDREEIPSHVWITHATLGHWDFSTWRSRLVDYANAHKDQLRVSAS